MAIDKYSGISSNTSKLKDGSKIAIIGSGPAGAFFTYYALDLAERLNINLKIDIYDEKDFSRFGPPGCNRCGGIVSESLVQILAADGINIPTDVVRRGIDSYVMHMDVGSVKIATPLHEKRIAAMYRGAGPRGTKGVNWGSFDAFLQNLAIEKGAKLISSRVTGVRTDGPLPVLTARGGISEEYELIIGAFGVNSPTIKLFKDLEFGFKPPETTKTFICEFALGQELVQKHFGNSMHVFLLAIPRLEFAALIPKRENVTLAMLGEDIDKGLVQSFLDNPEVKKCFPKELKLSDIYPCQCFPKINVKSAIKSFSDRIVLIGDCTTSKLYKNGIGSAYVSAKAAATTAIFQGVSARDFKNHYWPTCKKIEKDNLIGKFIFLFAKQVQKSNVAKHGILRMAAKEQGKEGKKRGMSMVLWDTFTGSAPYAEILKRTLMPQFIFRLIKETVLGMLFGSKDAMIEKTDEKGGALGKLYKDGEDIILQGETGNCMYVIQSGTVEILQTRDGKEVHIAYLKKGDFVGEMAIFDRVVRSSTVRAKGETRILTVDKDTLLHRIQEDPSVAFRIIEKLSLRIRGINNQLSRIKAPDRRNWENRLDDSEFKQIK